VNTIKHFQHLHDLVNQSIDKVIIMLISIKSITNPNDHNAEIGSYLQYRDWKLSTIESFLSMIKIALLPAQIIGNTQKIK
jgi:hypothetical protein